MTWAKRYPLLILLLVAAIIFSLSHIFLTEKNEEEEKAITYSNELRKKYGVPIIEENWVKDSRSRDREKWDDGIRGIASSSPTHLYKEIVYKSGRIYEEKDAFHFEFSDSLQFRLILYHHYLSDLSIPERTKNELIIYEPGKFPPSHSVTLLPPEADSIMRAWKIKD